MYANSIKDRTIKIDYWGNLTGTNKYKDCNRVFLYGINHKPTYVHHNVHTVAKSPNLSFGESPTNKKEINALKVFDLVSSSSN